MKKIAFMNRVLEQVENGSIILMHNAGGSDRSQSVAALKTIIPTLLQRGYQFVTIQQLANDAEQSNATTNFIAASYSATDSSHRRAQQDSNLRPHA